MFGNTHSTYGAVTKTLHWLTVLLMITVIPLALFAHSLPFGTSEELTRKAWYYSFHKTLGVTLFFTAILRIAWAASQPKPYPVREVGKLEHWLAETVHWLLYGGLIIVPLSGWIHHAASSGFAPIWWPLGQNLPLVPKSEGVSDFFGLLHYLTKNLLVAAIALHIVGALKHHFWDRDTTLRRMLPGRTDPGLLPPAEHSRLPAISAGIAYVAAILLGAGLFATSPSEAVDSPQLAQVETGWQVQEGSLGITVTQLGSDVSGSFADWSAAINFDETVGADGSFGDVEVTISIPSLTLGSVTEQALNADFLDAGTHATAVFTADILPAEGGYLAQGTLALKGAEAPVALPFDLEIDGDVAVMSGQVTLNRTDYNVGQSYPDESSLGFDVVVDVSLRAVRAAP